MKERRQSILDRRKIVNEVITRHEGGIRKITVKRKELAAKVYILQQEDKKLRDFAIEKMKERDVAVEKARVDFRDNEK